MWSGAYCAWSCSLTGPPVLQGVNAACKEIAGFMSGLPAVRVCVCGCVCVCMYVLVCAVLGYLNLPVTLSVPLSLRLLDVVCACVQVCFTYN
jgi:hypothetical protein